MFYLQNYRNLEFTKAMQPSSRKNIDLKKKGANKLLKAKR